MKSTRNIENIFDILAIDRKKDYKRLVISVSEISLAGFATDDRRLTIAEVKV